MSESDIRPCLRRAYQEVERVPVEGVASPVEDRLTGTAEQLRYLADDIPAGPEAVIYPDGGILEEIRYRLAEIDDDIDEDAADRLSSACDEIEAAIEALDDQRRKRYATDGA